jgi:hypothetical protein
LNDRGKQIVCRLMGRPARQFKRLLNRLCNKRLRHGKLLAGSHPARYGLAIFCFDTGPTRLPINFQIILDYFVSVIPNNLARFGGAVAGATQPCSAATRTGRGAAGVSYPSGGSGDGQGVGAAIPDFDPAREGFYERGMVEEMHDRMHNALSELVLRGAGRAAARTARRLPRGRAEAAARHTHQQLEGTRHAPPALAGGEAAKTARAPGAPGAARRRDDGAGVGRIRMHQPAWRRV